jgi:hypothetical protein
VSLCDSPWNSVSPNKALHRETQSEHRGTQRNVRCGTPRQARRRESVILRGTPCPQTKRYTERYTVITENHRDIISAFRVRAPGSTLSLVFIANMHEGSLITLPPHYLAFSTQRRSTSLVLKNTCFKKKVQSLQGLLEGVDWVVFRRTKLRFTARLECRRRVSSPDCRLSTPRGFRTTTSPGITGAWEQVAYLVSKITAHRTGETLSALLQA